MAASAGWVSRHLGLCVEKGVDLEVVKELRTISNPKLKAILVKIDLAVESEIPGSGDAKYDMLTALIMTELPPRAAPAKGIIEALLKGMGTGAKADLKDALEAPPVSQAEAVAPQGVDPASLPIGNAPGASLAVSETPESSTGNPKP
jgi:hypothetical protein